MNQTLTQPSPREALLIRFQNDALRLLWTVKREAEALFATAELRPLEAFTLDYLARGSPYPKDLADALGTSAPVVSVLLRSLEERDLITRQLDPEDHRRIRLALTARGEALREDLSASWHARFEGALETMNEDDLRTLTRLYTLLLET